MKVLQDGIKYALEGNGEEQILKFTSKDKNGEFLDGTTNEEVINALIERFYYLNNKGYSAENTAILIQLKSVRSLLKKRISKKLKKYGTATENKAYSYRGRE
jgi:hypothetical protein